MTFFWGPLLVLITMYYYVLLILPSITYYYAPPVIVLIVLIVVIVLIEGENVGVHLIFLRLISRVRSSILLVSHFKPHFQNQ